jgi:hypothetical protein
MNKGISEAAITVKIKGVVRLTTLKPSPAGRPSRNI